MTISTPIQISPTGAGEKTAGINEQCKSLHPSVGSFWVGEERLGLSAHRNTALHQGTNERCLRGCYQPLKRSQSASMAVPFRTTW
jgi:hypothetical protein